MAIMYPMTCWSAVMAVCYVAGTGNWETTMENYILVYNRVIASSEIFETRGLLLKRNFF